MQKNPKKHSKNQNRRIYYVNLARELRNKKKLAKKRITQSRFIHFFEYVWYIPNATCWILVSRRFRICMAKGGRESARPSYGRPKLTLISREKNHLRRCSKNLAGRNFDFRAKSSWEKIFNIYKNFLSRGFCSKVKIVAYQVFATPPKVIFWSHIDCLCSSNTNECFFIASQDRSLPSVRFLAKRESGPTFLLIRKICGRLPPALHKRTVFQHLLN